MTGHVVLTGAIALAPALAARQRQPIEFVQVQIVPLQALGVPEPVQAAPQTRPSEPTPSPVAKVEKPKEQPETTAAATEEPPGAPVPEVQKKSEPTPSAAAEGSNAPTQRRGSPFGHG